MNFPTYLDYAAPVHVQYEASLQVGAEYQHVHGRTHTLEEEKQNPRESVIARSLNVFFGLSATAATVTLVWWLL